MRDEAFEDRAADRYAGDLVGSGQNVGPGAGTNDFYAGHQTLQVEEKCLKRAFVAEIGRPKIAEDADFLPAITAIFFPMRHLYMSTWATSAAAQLIAGLRLQIVLTLHLQSILASQRVWDLGVNFTRQLADIPANQYSETIIPAGLQKRF